MAIKGTFKDMTFLELLQAMYLVRKTGRMEITFERKWAMVIFNEGQVWHIEPRGFQGATSDEILYQLCKMPEGNFIFQRIQILPQLERSVTVNSEEIIAQLVQRAEAEASEEPGDNPTQVLKMKEGAEAKVRYVPQNVKKVLQGIDGKRNVEDVVAASGLEAAAAQQIIKDLIAQEVLEIVDAPKEEAPAPAPAG